MRPARLVLTVALYSAVAGCHSITSTHIERAKDLCGWKTAKMHGIPTTLEVPHHFKIAVVDTYFERNGNVLRDMGCEKVITPGHLPPLLKERRVDVTVENTKEIFTVDFVRPGAGTLNTKATLDAERQYFTKIENKIEDKTIQDITAAINTLSGALNPAAGGGRSRGLFADPGVTRHDRVVAVTYVEVADPHALERIHEFLCQHLNGCNACKPDPQLAAHPAAAAAPRTPPAVVTVR